MIFRCRQRYFDLSDRALMMGIINVTPDSFSEKGLNFSSDNAIEAARKMIADGVDIIDIGGESSRPNAAPVSADEESSRIIPVIEGIRRFSDIPLSVDTWKAEVARKALNSGVEIINDITGFHRDMNMVEVARVNQAGCIVMHMRGTPQTMQQLTDYQDLIDEISTYFEESIAMLTMAGIGMDQICLDPGIGFSKTTAQNLLLLKSLALFHYLQRPLLVGPSRKSFIGNTLNIDDPQQRDWGTAAAVAWSIAQGSHIVRAHNVAAMRQVRDLILAIQNAEPAIESTD